MTARPRGADVGPESTGPREGALAGSASVRKGERATSLRYRMMALARTRENVISLGRGDPDLDTPAPIIEGGLARFAEHGHAPGSAGDPGHVADPGRAPGPGPTPDPVRGLLSLREGIARRYAAERGVTVDPATEIAITNGAQEGLFLAMLALVDPGDRVACQDPRYSSYDQAIGVAGGNIVPIPTGGDRPFPPRCRRPAQTRPGREDPRLRQPFQPHRLLRRAGGRAEAGPGRRRPRPGRPRRRDLRGCSLRRSPLPVVPRRGRRAAERTVVLSGFSKAYAMTGFRVGYLIGPPTPSSTLWRR